MTKDTKLSELVINKLTTAQYDGIATKDPNQLYIVTDAPGFDESRTNCITEIPQDIKLELGTKYSWFSNAFYIYFYTDSASVSINDKVYGYTNIHVVVGTVTQVSENEITVYFPEEYDAIPAGMEVNLTRDSSDDKSGILTLKAGSKVYVPNGSGVFDTITTTSDLTSSGVAFDSSAVFVVYVNGGLVVKESSQISSGPTAPLSVTDWWYDTTNNVIKSTTDWNTWYVIPNCSLPVALITLQLTTPYIASINQIFKGFGYIGSTVFALPNVTGLVPNGRNANGSLKNKLAKTQNVVLFTEQNWTQHQYQLLRSDANGLSVLSGTDYNYDIENNLIKRNNGTIIDAFVISECDLNGGVISNFKARNIFQSLDYNDTSRMAEQAMPSHKHVTLTIGASGSSYTAPANGYFSVRAAGTSTSDNWIEFTTGDSFLNEGIYGTVRWNYKKFYPARVGDVVTIKYNNMNFDYIVFIYAEGEN